METTEQVVKGVIYARYSSAGQRDESIEGQLRDCHAFAERYGITIIGEYCDRALTGTSDKRPEFQRMIRDSAKGQFEVLITWKNDRFARSRYDSAVYKYKLKQNGVRILYAKESIPDGPEGIILESVMEGFAEYYSANLSQNVKRGNYDSAMKRQTLGVTVYGLREGANKRYELDPATAPVVRKIFKDYAAGRSTVDIIEELNSNGFRTMRGNEFKKNSIRKILRNEKYIGVYKYADIRDENGIPPIVDKELFERVQRMLDMKHQKPAAKKEDGGFLLTGKLFCGECGAPMTGDGGTGKSGKVYSYYTCVNRRQKKCTKERVGKENIENLVVTHILDIISDDKIINDFADAYMEWQEKQETNSAVEGLKQRLSQTESAIKNTMSLIDSGLITDSLKSHLVQLEAERVDLEAGIAKAELSTPKLSKDNVLWFLRKLRSGRNTNDYSWRISLIETFVQSIYLYDDGRLIFHLNFSGTRSTATRQMLEQAVAEGELLCSKFAPSAAPQKLLSVSARVFFLFILLLL